MLTNADIQATFEAHRARVYRWAFGLCRKHDEAADAVQEAFTRMIQARPLLRSDRETIGWLRRVTQRVIIDRWRSAKVRKGHEMGVMPRDTARESNWSDEIEAMRSAILELSPQQVLVVIAKFYDDLTFEEIAGELGISTPTAKTHYLRAIAALRDHLKPTIAGGTHHAV
jgi:RNA polymerase sigma-70 factor (ECF subfamily)